MKEKIIQPPATNELTPLDKLISEMQAVTSEDRLTTLKRIKAAAEHKKQLSKEMDNSRLKHHK
jgi:hypothetical protein